MEKIAEVIAREVVETAVKAAATTIVILALARPLARVSMRRARPGPTTISRPGLAATSCSTQRTTTRYAGATTRESATRPWLASAPMAKPFTSATSGYPTTMLAPSITGGALVTNQRHQQCEGPSLSPSWRALSWPSARTHQIPKYKQCGISRFGGGIQAAVFIVHFAALCVAEKDPAWLGLSSEDSASQGQ